MRRTPISCRKALSSLNDDGFRPANATRNAACRATWGRPMTLRPHNSTRWMGSSRQPARSPGIHASRERLEAMVPCPGPAELGSVTGVCISPFVRPSQFPPAFAEGTLTFGRSSERGDRNSSVSQSLSKPFQACPDMKTREANGARDSARLWPGRHAGAFRRQHREAREDREDSQMNAGPAGCDGNLSEEMECSGGRGGGRARRISIASSRARNGRSNSRPIAVSVSDA
jgi:hypothetical protein